MMTMGGKKLYPGLRMGNSIHSRNLREGDMYAGEIILPAS
jgi:hypothetical protein